MKNYEVWIDDGCNCGLGFSGSYEECVRFMDEYDGDESLEIYEED